MCCVCLQVCMYMCVCVCVCMCVCVCVCVCVCHRCSYANCDAVKCPATKHQLFTLVRRALARASEREQCNMPQMSSGAAVRFLIYGLYGSDHTARMVNPLIELSCILYWSMSMGTYISDHSSSRLCGVTALSLTATCEFEQPRNKNGAGRKVRKYSSYTLEVHGM